MKLSFQFKLISNFLGDNSSKINFGQSLSDNIILEKELFND